MDRFCFANRNRKAAIDELVRWLKALGNFHPGYALCLSITIHPIPLLRLPISRLFSPISFAVDLEQLFIVPRLDVPLFNVHELRDGAVAHPSSPFAAFSLKGLASSSSTSRVLSSPPFSKANLRSCRFLSREHFALCRRFNAPSPTHALFPPFPPRHARAPSFISSSSLLASYSSRCKPEFSEARVLESVSPQVNRLLVDVGVEIKGNA